MCEGECRGEVTPPEVMAECEATAKAEADLNAECSPPSIGLDYQLSADAEATFSGDADAQVAFEARIQAFASAYAKLLAKGAKIQLIVESGGALGEAGVNAVGELVGNIVLSADADAQARIDAICAVGEVEVAGMALVAAGDSLTASAQGIASITGAISG
jgi:hypothetical protein